MAHTDSSAADLALLIGLAFTHLEPAAGSVEPPQPSASHGQVYNTVLLWDHSPHSLQHPPDRYWQPARLEAMGRC